MKNKPIIIINGEPNSIFLEIFFKSIKYKKFKSPLILISSLKILKLQMKKFKYKTKINLIEHKNLKKSKIDNKSKIKKSIKEIGFENTANIYSLSDSSKFGGKIGWVKENQLTK